VRAITEGNVAWCRESLPVHVELTPGPPRVVDLRVARQRADRSWVQCGFTVMVIPGLVAPEPTPLVAVTVKLAGPVAVG
jgi:hypothetical protein